MFMRKKADHIMERITDKNERPLSVNVRIMKPPPALHYSKSRTIESSDEEEERSMNNNSARHLNGKSGAHHQGNGVMSNGIHKANSSPSIILSGAKEVSSQSIDLALCPRILLNYQIDL